jgi:hypothetical protein
MFHLWNWLAILLFLTTAANSIFRGVLIVLDMTKAHANAGATFCDVTFGINQFTSASVTALYVAFMGTMTLPPCFEPFPRRAIHRQVVLYIAIMYLYGLGMSALPLFLGVKLERHRAWCFVADEDTYRWVFSWVPGIITLVMTLAFIGRVHLLSQQRNRRVLVFGYMQLLVAVMYVVFTSLQTAHVASPDTNPDSPAFAAFTVWLAGHECFRAVAFIYSERLVIDVEYRAALLMALGFRRKDEDDVDLRADGQHYGVIDTVGDETLTTFMSHSQDSRDRLLPRRGGSAASHDHNYDAYTEYSDESDGSRRFYSQADVSRGTMRGSAYTNA